MNSARSSFPVWKRVIDILASGAGLVVLSPLLFLIAAAIKVTSPGPALLKQQRVGRYGKVFGLWKFRTMRPNADAGTHRDHLNTLIAGNAPMTKLDAKDDPRVFPFGKVLRRSCLDELPQLINVFRGEMSLIGPRPCMPYEAEQYKPWQRRRFDAVPGMTGLWQVSGKNETTFTEMILLDIAYAGRVSFLLDVKILLKTIPSILAAGTQTRARLHTAAMRKDA